MYTYSAIPDTDKLIITSYLSQYLEQKFIETKRINDVYYLKLDKN